MQPILQDVAHGLHREGEHRLLPPNEQCITVVPAVQEHEPPTWRRCTELINTQFGPPSHTGIRGQGAIPVAAPLGEAAVSVAPSGRACRTLAPAEVAIRRQQGLGYICKELFVPGHHSKKLVLEVDPSVGNDEEDPEAPTRSSFLCKVHR